VSQYWLQRGTDELCGSVGRTGAVLARHLKVKWGRARGDWRAGEVGRGTVGWRGGGTHPAAPPDDPQGPAVPLYSRVDTLRILESQRG
jgi:hypothetical protein